MIFPTARWTGDVWSQHKNLGTALVVDEAWAYREGGLTSSPCISPHLVALSPHSHVKQQVLLVGREGETPWEGT